MRIAARTAGSPTRASAPESARDSALASGVGVTSLPVTTSAQHVALTNIESERPA